MGNNTSTGRALESFHYNYIYFQANRILQK